MGRWWAGQRAVGRPYVELTGRRTRLELPAGDLRRQRETAELLVARRRVEEGFLERRLAEEQLMQAYARFVRRVSDLLERQPLDGVARLSSLGHGVVVLRVDLDESAELRETRAEQFDVGRPDDHAVTVTRANELGDGTARSEEHTSELQSRGQLVCRLL